MTINTLTILDNLVTVLSGINGSGGYTTTVQNVYRHLRVPSETLMANRAAICVVPGEERYRYEANRDSIRVDLDIDLLGHVSASSETNRINATYNLLDDIWRALNLDVRRSSSAVDTQFLSAWTDASDLAGQESLGVRIHCVYYRTGGFS